ncbi:MAG: DinB family protein [Bacteroidota bacterium]
MNSLTDCANQLLLQLKEAVNSCRPEDFSRPLEELSGATFGQHIRHTLEFFVCLFDARNEKIVNYDDRKHDTLIESDQKLAVSVIQSIQDLLAKDLDNFSVSFIADYSMDGSGEQQISSSFYRELAYNIEHAIHHMALLKVAVQVSLTYISLPTTFGVASSTIRYRANKIEK